MFEKIIEEELKDLINDYQHISETGEYSLAKTIKGYAKSIFDKIGLELVAEGVAGVDMTEQKLYLNNLDYDYISRLVETKINNNIGKDIQILIKVKE